MWKKCLKIMEFGVPLLEKNGCLKDQAPLMVGAVVCVVCEDAESTPAM